MGSILNSRAENQKEMPALLIVPAFERPPVSRYLLGSKRTLITPIRINNSGEISYLKANELTTEEQWDRFVKESCEDSLLHLATLDPLMIRDEKGVIQMAVVTSESPLTASCILLPGFLQHFSAIFGPELLMRDAIRDDYLISAMPASTEIFELSKNGLRAVGSLNPDDE